MDEEIIACIKESDIKYLESGQFSKYIFPLERREAHEKKVPHLIIRLFVVTFTPDNEILYLVQKRSKNKRSYQEYFTDSASGHVLYQDDLELNAIKKNALRELEEEFGINQKYIKIIKFRDLKVEHDKLTKEISFTFLAVVDSNAELNPDPIELDAKHSKFYTKKELISILDNEKNIDRSKSIWKTLLNKDLALYFKDTRILKRKKKEIALFIGRFQPLHHGHLYIIRNILKSCKKIKIGIGSSQLSYEKNNPFSGVERKQFIQAALNKRHIKKDQYEIFEIPDIYNAKKWVDHVVSITGEFDVIYSNSNWVRALFSNKEFDVGKKYELFKKEYCGSNIRNLIGKNEIGWKRLVPKEVIDLIQKFTGIERIKKIYQKEDD
ncbi:MAG: nicotinamide-nucleotide adenylyltransferase [Promethearchaeota archaeon]